MRRHRTRPIFLLGLCVALVLVLRVFDSPLRDSTEPLDRAQTNASARRPAAAWLRGTGSSRFEARPVASEDAAPASREATDEDDAWLFRVEPLRGVLAWGRGGLLEEGVCEEFRVADVTLPAAQLITATPESAADPWRVEIRLDCVRGPPWDFILYAENGDYEEALGETDVEHGRRASLRVRALGWDESPIREATIPLDGEEAVKTDAAGEDMLPDVSAAEHSLEMRAPGRFPVRGSVTLREGGTAEVVLREPVGARPDVLVADAEGRPRPFACLDLQGGVAFDVLDGVQRLDLFTDARGRRRLERVQPGRVTISARWGSRRGSRTVDVRDRDTTTVHLIAK